MQALNTYSTCVVILPQKCLLQCTQDACYTFLYIMYITGKHCRPIHTIYIHIHIHIHIRIHQPICVCMSYKCCQSCVCTYVGLLSTYSTYTSMQRHTVDHAIQIPYIVLLWVCVHEQGSMCAVSHEQHTDMDHVCES